jgi:hypothetical protein
VKQSADEGLKRVAGADIPRDETGYISPYRARLKARVQSERDMDRNGIPRVDRVIPTLNKAYVVSRPDVRRADSIRSEASSARAQLAEIHSRVMQNRKKK